MLNHIGFDVCIYLYAQYYLINYNIDCWTIVLCMCVLYII